MAHKVKVKIPYYDECEHDGFLIFDAEIKTDCLETMNGVFRADLVRDVTIDCTPDIRDGEYDSFKLKIQQFEDALSELQSLAEDNYQKDFIYPTSSFRQANSSGYLAGVKDIFAIFCQIFKED